MNAAIDTSEKRSLFYEQAETKIIQFIRSTAGQATHRTGQPGKANTKCIKERHCEVGT